MDLFRVYHDELGFLPDTLDETVSYRVTNNQITSQVASQVIDAMYPSQAQSHDISVLIQPSTIDSLEPSYTCPSATSLLSNYSIDSSNPSWLAHLTTAAYTFESLDSISGVDPTASAWHTWFDHYFDNLSSKLCHSKFLPSSLALPSTLTDQVLRLGLYEYSFIYRDSPSSLAYSTARFGIFVAELAQNIRDVVDGASNSNYRHNFAHDGSISLLLSILQVDVMVWPGMGSEVIFELYELEGCDQDQEQEQHYLRILWGGQVLRSSNPSLQAGDGMEGLLGLNIFLRYVDGLVGKGAEKVPALCGLSG